MNGLYTNNYNYQSIYEKLQRENCTIEDLLDEDQVLNEIRSIKSNVIEL